MGGGDIIDTLRLGTGELDDVTSFHRHLHQGRRFGAN
jgi:hypothetical protein